MLGYADKLTRAPADMCRGDVHALRKAGIADGLGVAVEPWNA